MMYLKLLRLDHWRKNIFIFPGMVLAISTLEKSNFFSSPEVYWKVLIGFVSTCLVASSNYILNEWLDRSSDVFHPFKKQRPAITATLKAKFIYALYATCLVLGLMLGAVLGEHFCYALGLLGLMGCLYNIPPIRLKDVAYIDVLSESFNNPIRLCLGYFIFYRQGMPPSSALIAYWAIAGTFLTLKRYVELKRMNNSENAKLYRKSFRIYRPKSLLMMSYTYVLISGVFSTIFAYKYRPEYFLLFLLYTLFLIWYYKRALSEDSCVEYPEKALSNPNFVGWLVLLFIIFTFLTIF